MTFRWHCPAVLPSVVGVISKVSASDAGPGVRLSARRLGRPALIWNWCLCIVPRGRGGVRCQGGRGRVLGTKVFMVKSHEMDSLLKFIFSNLNGLFTCYSMYPQS